MTKQRIFPSPPEGHVGLLVYDSVNNQWYAVLGDADGHIQLDVAAVALPTGAAIESKQLPDGHNVTVDNPNIAVTGTFYPVTQPVSAASLPLPTDAATSAKQLADGHNVTVDNADLEVVQPTPADLKMAQHQFDGTTWRKSNMLWGYNSRHAKAGSNTASGTDNAVVIFNEVDVGELWVIEFASVYHNAGVAKRTSISVSDGVNTIYLLREEDGASDVYHISDKKVTLAAGDTITGTITSPGNGKSCWLRVWGHKMKIDM